MKREHQHRSTNSHRTTPPPAPLSAMDPKGKSAAPPVSTTKDSPPDAGEDELLAALGYKVRSSAMADVAQKLEQLEMAMSMGATAASIDDNAILSHLSSDAVHYNPSDLSTWLESMLSELNVPPPPPPPPPPRPPPPVPAAATLDPIAPAESSVTSVDFPSPPSRRPVDTDDLSAIIPRASSTESEDSRRERKRVRSSTATSSPPPSVPVVLVDSQETGIRLVHTLLACAEAVQQENAGAAEALVKQVGVLAMSQGGAMRKVATYFAEALARRIYRIHPANDAALDAALSDMLQSHFYEACPYLKFAHFTANQAILEALAGKAKVHIVDFSMKQGLQWPPLMQALALRPGGPPSFRLTGIGPPQPDNSDALQQVGWKLAQFAESLHVEFEYRGFVAGSLADLEPYMLSSYSATDDNDEDDGDDEDEEAVAVNTVFEFHRLLGQQGSVGKVLSTVKALRPSIMTVVEQEANHNGPVFLDRFTEALHYYSSMFDSLEGGGAVGDGRDQVMSEAYLGRQICNVVACEGPERTERHETAAQWRARMTESGFAPVPLGSNAFKQASMLLELFAGGEGYRVEERDGCLMLGWHTRPLITTSAWRLSSSPPSPINAGRTHRHGHP